MSVLDITNNPNRREGSNLNRAIFREKTVLDRDEIRRQAKQFLIDHPELDPKRAGWKRKFKPKNAFKTVEYVTIVGGDRNNVVDRPAIQRDRETYHAAYRAFKAGLTQIDAGSTSLRTWAVADPIARISDDLVEALAYFKIYTVEQVAGCADSNVPAIQGFRDLQKKAADFLEVQAEQKTEAASRAVLNEELQKRDAMIADQSKKYAELEAKLNALSAPEEATAIAPKIRKKKNEEAAP